jgi:SAM-dependent methyltransferase
MRESEIRPKNIFDEFLRLAKIDTDTYFANSKRENINCPACDTKGEHAFNKNNFYYSECSDCKTLYVDPRPEKQSFNEYYTNSPSTKYWATTFYKATEEARRSKIWKPKAKMISEVIEKINIDNIQLIDIGGGYGIFAEEIKKYLIKKPIIIEPSPHLAKVCRSKDFNVVEKFLEDIEPDDLPNGPKCFVSFELFEHLHNPKNFLLKLNSLMKPNDVFIFTTLSSLGLDIQILREKSPSVSPPHHLNFFNPDSVKIIFNRTGFKCISLKTPGKLDIDILNNNIKDINDNFWKNFLMTSSQDEKEKWQNLITNSGRSSHMMVVGSKL